MFLFDHDEYRGLAEANGILVMSERHHQDAVFSDILVMSEKTRECCLRFLAVIFQIFNKISFTTRMLSERTDGRGRVWEEFKEDNALDLSRF